MTVSLYKQVSQQELQILVISQFTLHANLKGNRPDFHLAMPPHQVYCIASWFVT